LDELIRAVLQSLPTIASAAVIGVCGYAYKRLKGFRGEHTELVHHLEEYEQSREEAAELRAMQDAQNFALREILGDMLDKEHARLVKQGYASPTEKLKFERKYNAYHGLGGNGTRTALYEDVLDMKSYKS
jgi:hypothetical protein